MAYGIYQPQRWRRQPTGPIAVNWQNGLSKGLVVAVSDNFEAVTRKRVLFDSRVTRAATSIGYGWYKETFLNASMPSTTGVKMPSGSVHTVAAYAQCTADAPTSGAFLERGISSFGNAVRFYWYPFNNQIATLYFNSPSGNTTNVAGGNFGPAFLRGTTVATVWDGSFSRIYVSGAQLAATAMTSVSTSANFEIQIGNNVGDVADYHWTGGIPCLAAWSRPLAPAELREWNNNPWQIFQPARSVIYNLPSVTPILSLPTVVNITATSAQPRVTVTF